MPKTKTTYYKNFALKYRPEIFGEVVGQDAITITLQNSLKLGRIPHAYFFYGPRGCGKTTIARILAKSLNCTGNKNDKPTDTPCGKCSQCMEIAAGSDIDVLEIDAASNTQVDKVREVIIDTVSLASSRDRYKVFILDEVHMLSAGSFNALLKTIEEPPPHVVFVLATTERHKVPATIISRCQSFRFKPIADKIIASHLQKIAKLEKIKIDDNALKIISRSAQGALRDGLTLLDRAVSYSKENITSETVFRMLGNTPVDIIEDAINALLTTDGKKLHKVFEKINSEGYDIYGFLKDLRFYFADLFYYGLKLAGRPFENADGIIKHTTPKQIAAITKKLAKINDEIRFSDMPHILAEMHCYTLLQSGFDPENLVHRLENMENRLSGGENQSEKPKKKDLKTTSLNSKSEKSPQKETDDNVIWEKLLDLLKKQSPMVYQFLSAGSFTRESDAVWTLNLADEFAKTTIETNQAKISGAIENLSGRKLKFKFDVLQNTEKISTDMTNETITDEQPLADNLNWEDVSSPDEIDSSVKNVLKHIEGEIIK